MTKKREKPPRWQKGGMEIPITVPSSKTESGETETVRIGLKWEVFRSRPMRPRDWTRREINSARGTFASVKDALDDGEEFRIEHVKDLEGSLTHAIRAWCWSHLRCKGAKDDDHSYRQAFEEKGPESLLQLKRQAMKRLVKKELILLGIESGSASTGKTVKAVQAAVDALLEAASSPPRNRRRFPARLLRFRPFRDPRRPRVRPGSWIDTGRYRPAVVLEVKPDPPHEMKISYDDDVEDFLPHISNWKSVRKRKRAPSLKAVFSPGDWIRHPFSGYGQVLEVRNSVMDVRYRKEGIATVAPDATLSRFEKVDDPGPEDTRPAAERFPPGTWIELDGFGRGVVLEHNGEVVTMDGETIEEIDVVASHGVVTVGESRTGEGPVIWKADRRPLDLGSPWGRRWAWWWRHRDLCGEPVCACCGYPNFDPGHGSYFRSKDCIICGFPDFGTGFESDSEPRVFFAEGCWRHRNAWSFPDPYDDEVELTPDEPSDREWEDFGYSILEAQRNFENSGSMYRPQDANALPLEKMAGLRREFVQTLERTMADPSGWHGRDEKVVKELRRKILSELKAAPPSET